VLGLAVVGDGGDGVRADDALAFGVGADLIGNFDIEATGKEPSGVSLGVADEPPVFHGNWLWGGSGRGRGGIGGVGGRLGLGLGGEFEDGWSAGDGFGDGSALEEINSGVFRHQVEVLLLAAGEDMDEELVAQGGFGDDGVLGVFGGEVLELLVELFVDDGVLFDPSGFVLGGCDLVEALAPFDDEEFLSVCNLCDAIGDGCDAVVDIDLAGGNVDVLMLELVKAGASGEESDQGKGQQQPGDVEPAGMFGGNQRWAQGRHRGTQSMLRITLMDCAGAGGAGCGSRGRKIGAIRLAGWGVPCAGGFP